VSYCRFSSDNWKSDVYSYADVNGGYTTHVAVSKLKGEVPTEVPFPKSGDEDAVQKWVESNRAVMAFLENAERVPLGLPHDGETFNDPDLQALRARLLSLRAVGYHVPERAIQRIDEEAGQ